MSTASPRESASAGARADRLTVIAVGLFGVPRPAAVGYALLFHASQIVPITLVGWLYLLRENMSLGEAAHSRPNVEPGAAG